MGDMYNDMPPLVNSNPYPPPGGGFPIYQGSNDPYSGYGGGYPGSAGYPGPGPVAGYPVPLTPDGRPDWSQQPSYGGGYEPYPPMASSPFMPQTPLQLQRTASRRSGYEEDPNRPWSQSPSMMRRSSFGGMAARPHHKVPTDWRDDFQMPGSQGLSRLLTMSKRFLGGAWP